MRTVAITILFLASCLGSPAGLASGVEISEWKVPYGNSRPRDPFVDSLGRVWFCGQAGGYLAYLEPGSGEFKKYQLADGAGPHNLVIDEHDQIWFAANTRPYIGRLDPKSGEVTKYPMPGATARDPHTLAFDRRGNIWFTAQVEQPDRSAQHRYRRGRPDRPPRLRVPTLWHQGGLQRSALGSVIWHP